MALEKKMETAAGVQGNYWRIIQHNMNYERLDAVVTLALYVSISHRFAGKASIFTSRTIDLGEEFLMSPFTNGVGIEENKRGAYLALKRKIVEEKKKPLKEQDQLILFFDGASDV